MTTNRYKSYWLPGLDNDDVDPDEVLHSAFAWLEREPCSGERLVLMNTLGMIRNRPFLTQASAPYTVVSPKARRRIAKARRRENAVLAIWPSHETLELADNLAGGGSLCVIPGSFDDLSHWIRRTSADALWNTDPPTDHSLELDESVRRALDSIIAFDGHNDFLGAGGKEEAIRRLRAIIRDGHRPEPTILESYVLTKGVRSFKGASRLREWYEGLLTGRRFYDYARRPI